MAGDSKFFVVIAVGMLENPERSGTERNGTERNGTEVIYTQYGCGRRIRIGKLVLICQLIESSSRVLYQPRRRDKHRADSIEPHQAY